MRKISLLIVLAAAVFAGCGLFGVEGSGYIVDNEYAFTDFTKISADHAFKLTIVPDTVYSVTVTCDDNIVSYLDVLQRDDGIEIGLKDWNNYYNVTLSAEVHMPAMNALALSGASGARVSEGFSSAAAVTVLASGASSVEILGLTCGSIRMELSGASDLTASAVSAGSLDAVLSGASDISASGAVTTESVNASGASHARLLDMAATSAGVILSGASDAWIDVGGGVITLSASGASTLYYAGTPVFGYQELSGGSGIRDVN